MAVNNPSLSPPAQQQRTTEISSSQLTNPPTTHLAMEAPNNWLEPSMDANSTLSSQTDTRISNDDDAIARHKHYLQYHQDIFNHQQQQADADRCLDLNMSRCMSPPISCRVRSVSSPALSQSLTPRPLRVRARSCLAVQPEEEITDHIDTFDYGPRAIDEEEIALEYGARLAAARAVSIHGAARIGSGSNVSQDLGAAFDQEEEEIEIEDENDNCLSGLCIPQSRFFLTSVICSNTMTRDGLANERTYLAWLSACNALCLVSFTFITRSLTLETLAENTQEGRKGQHKDRLSYVIGYVCFISACLATIYSLLKYLRNIRRISTRYPFVQAGPWTFTVGMFLGMLIMFVLVLAYTARL